jgi:hypothetical protein
MFFCPTFLIKMGINSGPNGCEGSEYGGDGKREEMNRVERAKDGQTS